VRHVLVHPLLWLVGACMMLAPSCAMDLVEENRRQAAEVYPTGMLRSEVVQMAHIQGKADIVGDIHNPDGYAAACLARIRADGLPEPAGYEAYWVFRYSFPASMPPPGLYLDYVFYDGNDRVMWSARKFED